MSSISTTPSASSVIEKTRVKKTISIPSILGQILLYLILLVGITYTLLPFVWMLSNSFKTSTEIIKLPPTFLPEHFTLQSFITIFNDPRIPIFRFYLNSIIVTITVCLMVLFSSSLAGFVFAKYRFFGKDTIFTLVLATLMVPAQVTMIPSYLILVRMGLIDNLLGLIVPAATSAFGIFLMRQFIESIPSEMIDAARIDGASEFGIFLEVILPQMGTALATLGIFQFMGTWNDYLWPLIVITTTEKRTLPIMLTWFSTQHGSRADLTMAASVLVILPILVVYFIFQRWIVRGIALTGFK